jgi:hypothetical protein
LGPDKKTRTKDTKGAHIQTPLRAKAKTHKRKTNNAYEKTLPKHTKTKKDKDKKTKDAYQKSNDQSRQRLADWWILLIGGY